MRLTWPLTGRSQQMRLIGAVLADPDLAGIVICGAAGVGKSRVAREALKAAASRGLQTRWAVGTAQSQNLPAGAFAEWIGPDTTDTLQLVRSVIDSLTSTARAHGVVVGVDDVHLLDDLSTFVVHQIIARRAAKVVMTVRDGEPIPAAIQEIWNSEKFAQLTLQPLSREDTTALLAATLGGHVHLDAVSRLWSLTRGNVLYLCNIVEQELADGRLAKLRGEWQWTGDPVVPPSLVEMIEARVAVLPSSVRDVIDAVAVGEPMELAALTRITDPAGIEDADRRGLITLDTVDDRIYVRLAHPLYGEVRRKHATEARLRHLRGLAAIELAKSGGADDMQTLVRRAALSIESDLEPDQDLLVRAARGAVWLADLRLAARLAKAAIAAGAGAEANLVQALALSWLSRGEEADTVFADVPTTDLTDAGRGQVAFLRAHNKLWLLADPAAAKEFVDDASQTMASGVARRCVDAFRTEYWTAMGKPQAARESSKDLVLEQLPEFVGGITAWAVAVASGDAGRTDKAVAAARAGYELVERSFDAGYMRFVIADGHVGALLQAGRVHEAAEVADRLHHLSAELPGAAQVLRNGVAGRAALGAGRLDAACSLLEPVGRLMFASNNASGYGYRYEIAHSTALAMRGSTDDALNALGTAEEHRHPSWRVVDYELQLARAWVAAAQRAVERAVATVLSAAETARGNGQFAAEVLCLQTATQFGDRSCAPRLRELAAIVEGPRAGIATRFAAALHDGDGAELAAVSQEFERMGDIVAAADAAAHAASAFHHAGVRASMYLCATRAESLATQCGGATTSALDAMPKPEQLTTRESEIVALIAEGLTNRAVAARLSVSVRTVEGHIYRAMAKTGAANRDELVKMQAPGATGRSNENE
ncbi:helix-turn-helix transcriptional regulator [Mycobacterium hubeiense]|uniref:helix-turn-helix transcriptional regulator n=1 Tax=Mycobacterium hubeiense TaxID=1867256 RepID=UPI000C7F5692|nr:LuxR C-terminal-related transcriptional regulator [Mycobacterium sp. QGD 101]